MPETFSKYNTAKITSVKLESIAHPHSTSQNLRPGASYFIPKVRIIYSKGILLKNTPIWPHTPNVLVWNLSVPEHPTQKIDWVAIEVNYLSPSIHPTSCIDNFIGRLVKREEAVSTKVRPSYIDINAAAIRDHSHKTFISAYFHRNWCLVRLLLRHKFVEEGSRAKTEP